MSKIASWFLVWTPGWMHLRTRKMFGAGVAHNFRWKGENIVARREQRARSGSVSWGSPNMTIPPSFSSVTGMWEHVFQKDPAWTTSRQTDGRTWHGARLRDPGGGMEGEAFSFAGLSFQDSPKRQRCHLTARRSLLTFLYHPCKESALSLLFYF